MRIHTSSAVNSGVVYAAARKANVDLVVWQQYGSRSADQAWEIKLEGNSRRRPNGGSSGAGSGYAATWDQWGVFLAEIFNADPEAHCWAYKDSDDFNFKTGHRFVDGWPIDNHGDHTFRYNGTPYQQECTKCSATNRWQ